MAAEKPYEKFMMRGEYVWINSMYTSEDPHRHIACGIGSTRSETLDHETQLDGFLDREVGGFEVTGWDLFGASDGLTGSEIGTHVGEGDKTFLEFLEDIDVPENTKNEVFTFEEWSFSSRRVAIPPPQAAFVPVKRARACE